MDTPKKYGWNDKLEQAWKKLDTEGLRPGRVVADFGTSLKVVTPDVITAELSGKLAHYSNRLDAPKVGDWVALRVSDNGHAVIESTLERRSEIARKAPGKQTIKQIIAANVDIAFVLLAVGGDFSVERLRRYLFQLSIYDITPVVVINKADRTDDLESLVAQIKPFNVPVLATIATEGVGVDAIREWILPGRTAILLGSSGVGKSTITNQLLGRDAQATQEVRQSDDTGKHTTVHRELFVLPGGGLLIDTPGIRELQLWGTEEDLYGSFDDIVRLTGQCAFSSCQHGSEDGCAVQRALSAGLLTQDKFDAYLTMKAELVKLKTREIAKKKRTNAKSKRNREREDRDLIKEMHEDLY